MKCGDICLVHYPFTDASAAKLRPVVVVSADEFNTRHDVVVLPVSSKPDRTDPYVIYLEPGSSHFSATGLRYPSAIRWTKPFTISRNIIRRRLGYLPEPLLSDVREAARSLFAG